MNGKRRLVVLLIVFLALIGGGGIAYYYRYQSRHYVSTDDARVAVDMVPVAPEIPGKIIAWNIKEGDIVEAGQVLGRQDLASTLTSGVANPQALSVSGGIMAQKAEITAPIAGMVIQSKAVQGQMATPGMSLAIIAASGHEYISANIKETAIERVRAGQWVDIRIDAYPGRVFTGRVETIGQAATSIFSLLPAQNTSGNYTKVTQVIPVKITLLNSSDVKLLPGMNASIRIHIS